MKKLSLLILLINIVFISTVYAGVEPQERLTNVQDTNKGTQNQILLHRGTAHTGTWTNVGDIREIRTNTSDISTNAKDIDVNASNINTNTSNISTNKSNITTNTTNITTNTNNISTIDTNIGDRTYIQDNYVTDGESLTSSINSLDIQTFTNTGNISNNRNLINNNSQRLDDHEGRIGDLEETQFNVMGEVQFIRKKNYTVSTYAKYDVRHSKVPEVGLKLTIGLGKSWTQEELERLETKLNKIEKLLHRVTGKNNPIETKMIKTENGYSIVIDEANTVKFLKKF